MKEFVKSEGIIYSGLGIALVALLFYDYGLLGGGKRLLRIICFMSSFSLAPILFSLLDSTSEIPKYNVALCGIFLVSLFLLWVFSISIPWVGIMVFFVVFILLFGTRFLISKYKL